MLVVVRRDVEHLQPGDGVVGDGGHPLGVEPLRRQPLGVGHLGPELGPGQRQPLPLQVVEARVEGGEGVVSRHGRQRDGAVPGEVLHGVGGGVEALQLGGFDLEPGLHPLPELALPELPLPQLPLPELAHAGVGRVQAGHVVGQERVGRAERDEEGVVPVGGGHDVGAGVLAERAQRGRVRPDVGRHRRDGGGRGLEGRTHVGGARHLGPVQSAVVGRAGRFLIGRKRVKLGFIHAFQAILVSQALPMPLD